MKNGEFKRMGDNLSCSRLHTICALCEYAARRCAYKMQAFETAHYMCLNTRVEFVSKTAWIIVTGLSHNFDDTRDEVEVEISKSGQSDVGYIDLSVTMLSEEGEESTILYRRIYDTFKRRYLYTGQPQNRRIQRNT